MGTRNVQAGQALAPNLPAMDIQTMVMHCLLRTVGNITLHGRARPASSCRSITALMRTVRCNRAGVPQAGYGTPVHDARCSRRIAGILLTASR
jgi:hypothetical protein